MYTCINQFLLLFLYLLLLTIFFPLHEDPGDGPAGDSVDGADGTTEGSGADE